MPEIRQAIVVISDPPIPTDDFEWLRFISDLNHLNANVPLEDFDVERVGNTDQWKYEFKALDGRQWKQKIIFQDGINEPPHMTFTVAPPGFMEDSEFVWHRPIRTACIEFIRKFSLTRLHWTGECL